MVGRGRTGWAGKNSSFAVLPSNMHKHCVKISRNNARFTCFLYAYVYIY